MKNLFERYLMIEEENIYTPATPEERKERRSEFALKYIEDLIQSGKARRNSDGTVDVEGDVDLIKMNLTELPVRFGRVSGDFDCSGNNLKSLEWCPEYVGGYFWCSSNKLESLEGSPEYVGEDFICSDNNLTSLEGSPSKVSGYFWCSSNNLESLEGSPKYVSGDFICVNQKNGHEFTEEEVEAVCNVSGNIMV